MASTELPKKINHTIKNQGNAENGDRNGRLAVILADMLNSALAWEQIHGQTQHENVALKKKRVNSDDDS
jgi:hypothetical protein